MIKVCGVCRGVRVQPARGVGGFPTTLIGIAEPKHNGYPGEEEITEVTVPKSFMEKGVPQVANNLKDKHIEVPVFIKARAYKDKAYVDYVMNGDIKQLSFGAAPAAAVLAVK